MASRKPITQSAGVLEQLQSVDTLTVGDYDLPNTISDDGKVLVTVNSAAVWEFYSHADLTNTTVDDHHAQSHEHNGADSSGTVNHADLTNLTTDNHHAKSHIHSGDGSGTVEHDDTANITVNDHHDQSHTHNGADSSGVVEHDDTANITVDDHHDQSHTHNGADSSGVVEHDDTANITVNDHHDQSHSHNGADSSGTVNHAHLTGIAVDDHHNKVHTHNGTDGSGVVEHDDTANGTIASHDTTGTGAELTTLTDGSNADALHVHTSSGVSGNVTYYVATTGNDSTGTGNIASPWASISRALDEVNLYRFDKDAVATVELAAGQYEMRTVDVKTTSIPQLVIQGATRYQYDLTAVTAVASIGSGIYDITFTVNTTTGMSTSDFLAIRTLVSGRIYNGAWEIRDVISGTSVKVRVDSPLITPGTGAMSNVDGWVMPTVIETRDANGFNLHWDHVQITNLTFKKGADGVNAMDVNGVGQIHIGPYVACNGYVDGSGVASWGAYCELDYVFVSDSWLALWPRRGGGMYVLDTCLGGNITGLQTYASAVNFAGVLMAGNTFAGVSCYQGGTFRSVDSDYVGGGFAVWANSESFAHATAADGNTFASNTTDFSPAANTEGNLNSYMKA